MNKGLFRKASLDRVSSPEQLNDYIRVSNPSVWLILGAVAALIIAVFVWAIWGDLPTKTAVRGRAEGGVVTCYLPAEGAAGITSDKTVEYGDITGRVISVGTRALAYDDVSEALGGDEYALYMLGVGEWNVPVTMEIEGAPDGIIDVSVITDTISPIDFLLN